MNNAKKFVFVRGEGVLHIQFLFDFGEYAVDNEAESLTNEEINTLKTDYSQSYAQLHEGALRVEHGLNQ